MGNVVVRDVECAASDGTLIYYRVEHPEGWTEGTVCAVFRQKTWREPRRIGAPGERLGGECEREEVSLVTLRGPLLAHSSSPAPRGRFLDGTFLSIFLAVVAFFYCAEARADVTAAVVAGPERVSATTTIAVTPSISATWSHPSGALLSLVGNGSLLLTVRSDGVRPGGRATLGGRIGYRWESLDVVLGLGAAAYSMYACSPDWCAPVSGVAPQGSFAIDLKPGWFDDRIGVRASFDALYYGGKSIVLPSDISVTGQLGLYLRLWK